MILSDLRVEETSGWTRLSALMTREGVDGAPRRLWFEARPAESGMLVAAWEAFVVAAYPLAVAAGERRLAVEGTLCPRLADDLPLYGRAIAASDRPLPRLEPARGRSAPLPVQTAPTASFLSGGVDALALLRANQLDHDETHPGRIRLAINIFGLNTYDFVEGRPVAEREAAFDRYLRRLESFGEAVGVRVVPVRTNIRDFYPDFRAWGQGGSVAGTVAAGLAVGGGMRALWLASDGFRPDPRPVFAQHFQAHNLATAAVEVRSGQLGTSRLEKVRIIADWAEARGVLRSCYYLQVPPDGRVNCGQCEKCIRTMLALEALGRLDQFQTFGASELAPADIAAGEKSLPHGADQFYAELVGPLRSVGRPDLAREAAAIASRVERRRSGGSGLADRVARVIGLARTPPEQRP